MADISVDRLVVDIEARTRNFERQLKKIEGQVNGSTRKMASSFKSLESQIMTAGKVLAGFGLALTAGYLAQLPGMVKEAVQRLGDLGEAASKAGISIKELQQLTFAGIGVGVDQEKIISSMQMFNKLVGEAATKGNDLSKLFAANGVALRDQNGQIRGTVELLGEVADLVSTAATSQERTRVAVQALGRSGAELLPFLEQGGAAIRDLMREAVAVGYVARDELVTTADEFADAWTRASEIAGQELRKNLVTAVAEFMPLIVRLDDWIKSKVGIGMFLRDKSLGELLSDSGLDMGSSQSNKSAKGNRLTSRTRTVVPTSADEKAAKAAEDHAAQIARVIQQLVFEQEQIKRTAVEQEVHNQLRAAGTTLATKEGQEIAKRVRELAAAREAQEAWDKAIKKAAEDRIEAYNQLRESLMQIGEIGVDALSDFIIEGEKGIDVVKRLAKALAHAALQALFLGQGPMSGLLGGGSGLLGSLVGGLLGGSPASAAGAVGLAGLRAGGGPVSAGKVYGVGEKGPELFVPRAPGTIVPNHALGGGGPSFTFAPVINAPGADAARLTQVENTLVQMHRTFDRRALSVFQAEKTRNPMFARP